MWGKFYSGHAKHRFSQWLAPHRKAYPHDNFLQWLIIILAMCASIYSIFGPRPLRTKYAFHSLILVFIAHSIAFGFQRALYAESVLHGTESAIIAMSAFIQAAMEMRKKKQLGGMVVLVFGISGILWGMKWAWFKRVVDQKVLMNGSRFCVAVSGILLGLSKAPLVLDKTQRRRLAQPILLSVAAILRLYTNHLWEERVLTSFYIINIVANLFEAIYRMIKVCKTKIKASHQRHSPRRKVRQ